MPRKRSERRQQLNNVISAIEMITRIVATARIVGEIIHQHRNIWRGMVRCRTSANCSTATTSSNDVMNAKSAPEITPAKSAALHFQWYEQVLRLFALARVNDLSNPESVAVTVMITNGVPKTACARIIPQ